MKDCESCSQDWNCIVNHDLNRCQHYRPQTCYNCAHHTAKDRYGYSRCAIPDQPCIWEPRARQFVSYEQMEMEI